jgi:peptide/nickel transport system permease protein
MSSADQTPVPWDPQGVEHVEPILLQSSELATVARPGTPGEELATPADRRSTRRRMLHLARRPYTLSMLILLAAIVFIAAFGPLLAPYNPLKIDVLNETLPPSTAHFFGTDDIGHDIFSRVLVGARYSLEVVVIILSLAILIGVVIGAVAGYFGGLIDEALMRITEIFLAFPTLILSLAVAATLGPSLVNVMISIGIVSWPGYARLLRGQILAVKNFTYVEAAYSVGVPPLRVLGRHVLPNAIAPLIAQVSLDLAGTLLTAASLGFLGLGAQPPTPEWGTMVSSGLQYTLSAWWYPTFPGLAIFVTALCLNSLGEYLRDVFAPETVD